MLFEDRGVRSSVYVYWNVFREAGRMTITTKSVLNLDCPHWPDYQIQLCTFCRGHCPCSTQISSDLLSLSGWPPPVQFTVLMLPKACICPSSGDCPRALTVILGKQKYAKVVSLSSSSNITLSRESLGPGVGEGGSAALPVVRTRS